MEKGHTHTGSFVINPVKVGESMQGEQRERAEGRELPPFRIKQVERWEETQKVNIRTDTLSRSRELMGATTQGCPLLTFLRLWEVNPEHQKKGLFTLVLSKRTLCSDGNVLYLHCPTQEPQATCGY